MATKYHRPLLLALSLLVVPSACTKDPRFVDDPAQLIGVWGINNLYSRRFDEMPVIQHVAVYPDHAEFTPGQRTFDVAGSWHDNGFWCHAADGGDIEAVRLIAPEFVELRVAAFISGSNQVLKLYKEKGSPAEMKALADKYPPPLPHPPPSGVIMPGMSEFQVLSLPWQPDQILNATDWNQACESKGYTPTAGARDQDAMILCYHCDNPRLAEFCVTIRNHTVIAVAGGNG